MNIYYIIPGMILFGFGTANFVAIVYRQAIKSSNEPINLTVSNLATLGHVLLTTHKRRVFPIGYRVFENFLSEK